MQIIKNIKLTTNVKVNNDNTNIKLTTKVIVNIDNRNIYPILKALGRPAKVIPQWYAIIISIQYLKQFQK